MATFLPLLPDLVYIVKALTREMEWHESAWLWALLSALLFFRFIMSEPTRNPKVPTISLPPAIPWRMNQTRKPRRLKVRNYSLNKRVDLRPVKVPIRDPIRELLKPLTWRWKRRVPMEQMTPKPPKPKRRPKTLHEMLASKKGWREPTFEEKKADRISEYERSKSRLLHLEMWLNYDLDEFLSKVDPIKEFRALAQLSNANFFGRAPKKKQQQRRDQALIAAAQFSQIKPGLGLRSIFDPGGGSNTADLTRNRSVYFSEDLNELPIVIDTGASMSLTPNIKDFRGPLVPSTTNELRGLSHSTPVMGMGYVEWTVRDIFGVIRTIRTKAYYVPSATIRLFSPQTYFREQNAGNLLVTAKSTVLTLSDGSDCEFPYHNGSNLPLMLPHYQQQVGLTFEDVSYLTSNGGINQLSTLMSVADETNQNLTRPQKELLKWHWKLGHANFPWLQRLATVPKQPTEGVPLPIIQSSLPTMATCPAPMCTACQLAKQNRRGAGSVILKHIPAKEMLLKRDILKPGQKVSIDQYVSALPGRLTHTAGKEAKTEQYNGGTLFVDHASAFIFIRHQVSLRAGETLRAKAAFERIALEHGVRVKGYLADNVPFAAKEFVADITQKNQTIEYSGTGAHHQNGVAERSIQTVTRWARAMMLHAVIHWPDQAEVSLWPFALEYAVYLWNNIPSKISLLAPIEIFTSTKFDNYDHLHRTHVWGCPVYVLDPKLQDGKKLPKWNPRSRRGRFLGISPSHSTLIGRILNLTTGRITPQYHVVYDDLYTTVPNAESGGQPDTEPFRAERWNQLIQSGSERYLDEEVDERGHRIPAPPLHDDWLTENERRTREATRANRRRARIIQAAPPLNQLHPGPVLAPEGEMGNDGVPIIEGGPIDDPDEEDEAPVFPIDDDDDLSLPEGVDADQLVDNNDNIVEVPAAEPQPVDEQDVSMRGRVRRRNPRFSGDEWANYQRTGVVRQKVRAEVLNQQYLNALKWEATVTMLKSADLRAMMAVVQEHTDLDDETVEWLHPLAFAAKANAEDNPSWEEAMNGINRAGYWKACETELDTLENKDAWEVVDRQD